MSGWSNDIGQPLTMASAVALEEAGRLAFVNGALYRYGQVDATVTLGHLFYKKTVSAKGVCDIYAKHDHTTAAIFAKTRAGGWPCFSGTSALPFGWFWVGGKLDTTVLASILTDTNVADGDQLIADSAADGAVKPYTLGTNDGYIVAVAHAADSSSALTSATALIVPC